MPSRSENWTSDGVLLAWRLDGQDWQFSYVASKKTCQFIDSASLGFNLSPALVRSFEIRVTNWAYGIQLESVLVGNYERLLSIARLPRNIEIIGDLLSAGQYTTYESISSWFWGGIGNAEFTISAYLGICLVDTDCWDNAHGKTYQWYRTTDTSPRSLEMYGNDPEVWDFGVHPSADIVIINNLGTNDNNSQNNVTGQKFQ